MKKPLITLLVLCIWLSIILTTLFVTNFINVDEGAITIIIVLSSILCGTHLLFYGKCILLLSGKKLDTFKPLSKLEFYTLSILLILIVFSLVFAYSFVFIATKTFDKLPLFVRQISLVYPILALFLNLRKILRPSKNTHEK
jgi:hypothetical protein